MTIVCRTRTIYAAPTVESRKLTRLPDQYPTAEIMTKEGFRHNNDQLRQRYYAAILLR